MKNRSVMFFCGNLTHSGGTERALVNTANALVKRGYSVNIVSLCGCDKSYFKLSDEIEIHWLQSKTLKSDIVKNFNSLKEISAGAKPDIWVDVDSILIFYSILFHKRLRETKFVSWEHFNFNMKFEVNPILRKISRRMLVKSNNTIVVLSEYDRKKFEDIKGRKCTVRCILNSVEPLDIVPDYSVKTAVAVGGLVPGKRYDRLLDIWQQVSGNDWQLKIYGNGPERQKLEEMISNKGIKSVELPGISSSKEKMYGNASVFLMTSENEGLSMAMIEAMEAGLGILTFDCGGGIRENVIDGENGFVVADNDMEAYKEKLDCILKSESMRKSIGDGSGKMAEKYSVDTVIHDWEELFESL